MTPIPEQTRSITDALAKELTDRGLLIEAGFATLRGMVMHPDASDDQVRELRMAFFAGAQHLFESIMNILDPGEEPTDDDLKRIDLIDQELRRFIKEFALRHQPAEGRA
jgi:hypothetical protein